jgi:hypothetical protein
MHVDELDGHNEQPTIAQSIGNQSIAAVAALRLVNDEIVRHIDSDDFDNTALLAQTGLRLLNSVKLPADDIEAVFEAHRLGRLVAVFPSSTPCADLHTLDALLALAMSGHPRLDLIESVKVSARPRRPVAPTSITPTARG